MEKQEINKTKLWRTFVRVIRYSYEQKRLFFLAMFLTLMGTGFQLLSPFVLGLFFNYAQQQMTLATPDYSQFISLTAIYITIELSRNIVHSINDYFVSKWWIYSQVGIFYKLYEHTIDLSIDFFEKQPTGKIRERIWEGSQSIINILEKTFLEIVPQFIFITIALIILFAIKPFFGLLVLIIVPLYFWLSRIFISELTNISTKGRVIWEDLSTLVTETIFNIKTVKTYANEDTHKQKILKQSDSAKEIEVKWQKKNAQLRLLRGVILGLTKASALALGFYYVIHGEMLLGSLIVVWSYVTQSLDPITGIARQIDQMQKDLVGISLSFSYLDTKSSVQDANPSRKLKVNKGQISFDNVSFRYKDRNVIKGLNLEVPAGKVVAIVGKSGSGKSTLVKLLLRFYDPQGGKITIDGKDIKNYTQKSLRKCISTVMQDSVLFNDTISNNISYAVGKASNADLIKASKASSSYGFINNLPNKFSSIVGERGVRLSGGEQQRINIARAVLRNSPIIVFDEATSSLDSESEQMIQEAMWKIIEGKTTIIIAHRLSTVMKADIIVVMDKGKVTEQGTHQDLVAKKGIYSKLFEIQSGGYLDTIDSELVEVDAK